MSSNIVTQVAEKIGYPVALSDFVSCGQLHATEIGLARCQSEPLVAALRTVGEGLTTGKRSRAKTRRVQDQMVVLTLIMVCGDVEGKATMTDEEGAAFLEINSGPLAQLMLPAYTATLPGVLQTMGIGAAAITADFPD